MERTPNVSWQTYLQAVQLGLPSGQLVELGMARYDPLNRGFKQENAVAALQHVSDTPKGTLGVDDMKGPNQHSVQPGLQPLSVLSQFLPPAAAHLFTPQKPGNLNQNAASPPVALIPYTAHVPTGCVHTTGPQGTNSSVRTREVLSDVMPHISNNSSLILQNPVQNHFGPGPPHLPAEHPVQTSPALQRPSTGQQLAPLHWQQPRPNLPVLHNAIDTPQQPQFGEEQLYEKVDWMKQMLAAVRQDVDLNTCADLLLECGFDEHLALTKAMDLAASRPAAPPAACHDQPVLPSAQQLQQEAMDKQFAEMLQQQEQQEQHTHQHPPPPVLSDLHSRPGSHDSGPGGQPPLLPLDDSELSHALAAEEAFYSKVSQGRHSLMC
jgi:hypothetical protein